MTDLLQQLVKKGFLDKKTAESLELENKESGKKIEELLLEKKLVSEEVLFGLKSEILKIPLKEISPDDVSLSHLELIPEESVVYYKMIPLQKKNRVLEIGMVYPEDLQTQEALKFLARQGKFEYQIFLIKLKTFNELFKKYQGLKQEVTKILGELEKERKPLEIEITPSGKKELERLAEEAPITKIVSVVLRQGVEGNASDIHIEPSGDKVRIRFRIDGILYSSLFLPLKLLPSIIARIKILSNLKIDETRIPQDGRFSGVFDGKTVDFRVSTFPIILGEKTAIRILDPKEGVKEFEQLGLEKRNFEIIRKTLESPYGLILVTGPTGSGKTTTLYGFLNKLNKEGVNIVTVEDPVEYYIPGLNQSQIKPEIGYDFAPALRWILRQDPDIIMVGEIRDQETATLVVHASLTGHLVLSTLHTSNVIGVIPRLIDLGIPSFLIPSTLKVALNQRLIRKLCPNCRIEKKLLPAIQKIILEEINSFPPAIKKDFKIPDTIKIYEAKGCKKCNFKGYSGRIGVFEILEMTDNLAEIIKDPTDVKLREEAFRQGMLTMKQDGILKVLQGITTIEEVLKTTE